MIDRTDRSLLAVEMATTATALVGRRGDPVISLAIPDWGRLVRLGRLGVFRGEVTRSRIFVPTDNAADALHIVTSIIERGRIVDYVAFRPDHPVAWGRRAGFGNVLVSPSIERAWPFLHRPLASLTLHRRPIDGCELAGKGRASSTGDRWIRARSWDSARSARFPCRMAELLAGSPRR